MSPGGVYQRGRVGTTAASTDWPTEGCGVFAIRTAARSLDATPEPKQPDLHNVFLAHATADVVVKVKHGLADFLVQQETPGARKRKQTL